jgi:hypothetical protein
MASAKGTARGTPLLITPASLIDGAWHYAAAADAVNEQHPELWHVINHLLGISIELALKALLLQHGYTDKHLRKLGHNLHALFAEAVEHGLRYTDSRNFRLIMHGNHYRDRLFAYPALGLGTVATIRPWSVRELADGIVGEVFVALCGAERYEAVRSEPGLCIKSTYRRDSTQTSGSGDQTG